MSSSESQRARRRRHHTRSRNGCRECKQRHIRCDELKPYCTGCLVHGRGCHYDGSGPHAHVPPRGRMSGNASPEIVGVDPFEILPIPMPFKSMQLLHHATHFRLLTTTVVAKNPNASLAGLVMHNAATFRSFLLIAGIHHVWAGGSLQAIEETILHHKVEAIRVVNGMIGDPVLSHSDTCIISMVGLAMVEAALGDATAAEAHLKALARLFDERRPAQNNYRLFGLVERLILLAASLVAASKDKKTDGRHYFVAEPREDPEQNHHFTRPTRPVFSAVPFLSIHLSPFYHSTPPDIEACNADAECEIIATALRRLSSPIQPQDADSSDDDVSSKSPKQQAQRTLREDAESYIGCLLFKPSRPVHSSKSSFVDHNQATTQSLRPPGTNIWPNEVETAGRRFNNFSERPFVNLPSTIFPSTSRAWACAGFLYLHLIVDCLSRQRSYTPVPANMDIHLQHYLIETLQQDLEHTQEAMCIGAHSSELWLWKTILGSYVVAKTTLEAFDGASDSDGSEDEDENLARVANRLTVGSRFRPSGRSSPESSSSGLIGLQSWFAAKLRLWSSEARVKTWDGAKKALHRIAWPESFGDDNVLAQLWEEAMDSEPPVS